MSDRFTLHLAAPPGEWINDPNGLVFAGGRYHLFVQHSLSSEASEIGWGHASSSDLLHWCWHGPAIALDDAVSAYSGCITGAAPLEAWLTRHDARGAEPVQSQWRVTSDDGENWSLDAAAVGPSGRNVRDPFVFFCAATQDWRMLVARPCGWTSWHADGPSTIEVWRSADRIGWERAGQIGPWSRPGVMWEVPVLIDFGDTQVLVISTVCRSDESSRCAVRYWHGRFDGCSFERHDDTGMLLDLGPDFYALCINTTDGWPTGDRVALAWGSSWRTARATRWPAEAHGGPLTLPRTLGFDGGRLTQIPVEQAIDHADFTHLWVPGTPWTLVFAGTTGSVRVSISGDGVLVAERIEADPLLDWRLEELVQFAATTSVTGFVDAGLIELFFAPWGRTLTVYLSGAALAGEPASA